MLEAVLFLWFYLAGSIVAGVIAKERGRSGIRWFALSLLMSPVLALVMLALMPSFEAGPWERRCEHCGEMVSSRASVCMHCSESVTPTPREAFQKRTRCPECAELILVEAKRCRYCALVLTKPVDYPVLTDVVDETPSEEPSAPQAEQT